MIVSNYIPHSLSKNSRTLKVFLVLALLVHRVNAQESQATKPLPAPTSAKARVNSWQLHQRLEQTSPFRELAWEAVGPRKQGGRIEAIAVPPRDAPGQMNTMYVGVGSGGLWKTVNNGTTWRPIFQGEATAAIGDVAVAGSNPDHVWVGTGEVLMTPRSTIPGIGVFKSIDAGKTWENMGLHDTHHIARVCIDPSDEQTVYVAAMGRLATTNEERGVFKTCDGGKTWEKVLYLDEFTSAIDLVISPGDSQTLFATTWRRALYGANHYGETSGVYRSTDGGANWRRLEGGLVSGAEVGRIAIDVAASNSKVVYALVDDQRGDALYRSSDGGESWSRVNEQPVRASWDWCEICISPDNENEVYNIGQNSFVSRDGGQTFTKIGGNISRLQPHKSRVLHLDTHSMWIDPENTDRVVFGNDGGLYMSYDRCENWLHLNNLPIAEVYAATYDMEQPFNIYIGTQDNAALFGPNTHRPEDGSLDEWTQIYIDRWGGGDAYFTYRDPNDSDTIYYESQYGGLYRQSVSADRSKSIRPQQLGNEPLRFAWMTPYFPSRYESKHLYVGAQRVFKSENRGDVWRVISPDLTKGPDSPNLLYQAVTALAESPHVEGTLLAGTDNGNLWLTHDDGANWKQIDHELPDLQISRIEFSPHDSQRFYVAMTGMRYDNFKPFVFRCDDGGTSWQDISVGLPLEPIHVIREDPKVKDLLYVGTDLGTYVSTDGGKKWNSLCNNLPTVAVHDLFVHPRDNTLVAGTHGLGVFVMEAGKVQTIAKQGSVD
ncbi:MAG: hypothetical protein VXZ82_24795 [Planctomycetota bacterium]|nr:hypothetical protein [Planctomycetota bacterium]